MENKKMNTDEAHRFFGIEFNNKIFQLAEKEALTNDEKNEIIALAHASYLHWRNYSGCKKVNIQRAFYMITKAYIAVENKLEAMKYAQICYDFTNANITEMQDFDIAYCHEIMARSAALNNQENKFKKHYTIVLESLPKIKNKEDLKWLEKDFKSGKWFGLVN